MLPGASVLHRTLWPSSRSRRALAAIPGHGAEPARASHDFGPTLGVRGARSGRSRADAARLCRPHRAYVTEEADRLSGPIGQPYDLGRVLGGGRPAGVTLAVAGDQPIDPDPAGGSPGGQDDDGEQRVEGTDAGRSRHHIGEQESQAAERRERAAQLRSAVLAMDIGESDGIDVAAELARDRGDER